MELRWNCSGPDDTLAAGDCLGRRARPGLLILLQGPLGAGKTLFTKGVARGLGVVAWRYVTSPTFAIHNVYQGRLPLHHLDLYRLDGLDDMESIGIEEVLYGPSVCVIEWPDSFLDQLPAEHLLIRFALADVGGRSLSAKAVGSVAAEALQDWQQELHLMQSSGGWST